MKLQGLNSCRGYFYIPANEGIGGLSYIVDKDGHALYLIKKSGLPDDIKKQLIGGNAGEGTYTDYQSLNDVYGVTENLVVYYSESSESDLVSISNVTLDMDKPSRMVYSSQSSMYNFLSIYDTDGDGEISSQEVKSVKKMTIDQNSGIADLRDFYNFCTLETIVFKDVNLDNLSGLENCSYLYHVSFRNSTANNYSSLGKIKKLQYLNFYIINDEELEKICSKDFGIARYDIPTLKYLAFTGDTRFYDWPGQLQMISSVNSYTRPGNKTITTIEPLANLTNTTKSAVQYLQLQCNSISGNLVGIKDYTNLILLRCETNYITSLDGLENMQELRYLDVAKNSLGKTTIYDSDGIAIVEYASEATAAASITNTEVGEGTALKALKNISNLKILQAIDNPNLSNVSWLANGGAITSLYLSGCSSTMNINSLYKIDYEEDGTTIKSKTGVLYQCIENGSTYSLPVTWLNGTKFAISSNLIYRWS